MLKALKKIFAKGDAAPQAAEPVAVTPAAQPPVEKAPARQHAKPRAAAKPQAAPQPGNQARAEQPARDKPRRERKPKPQASLWKPEDFVVEPQEGKTRFHDFKLSNELMHAIHDLG
ncbi:MAG: ATP-dependent RNA helicase RhlB, partial [Pseudomonas sp.]|nr:ATP-dependent RNA helicase RhlB [Pseudomonas sp.]